MKATALTFLIAFALTLLCAIGIAIGKLLTGKNSFSCKRCGTPEQSDKSSCELCKKKDCKKKR